MGQLPNSPPSAKDVPPLEKKAGPVFHDNVAKVRVTPGGALRTATFHGKTITADGVTVSPSELGWDHADLAAAEADPSLVIERLDAKGNLIRKDGSRYPTSGDLTPKPSAKGKDVVPGTKPEEM